MSEWTTQRISRENVEKVNSIGTGSDFDERLETVLEAVDEYEKDIIEELVEEKVESALRRR